MQYFWTLEFGFFCFSHHTTRFQLFPMLHSHDLFFTITLYLSLFDFNCLYYLDIFALPRWKRHSGAGPRTHQRRTSKECTPHNTAAAPPSIIPESSYIHCNRAIGHLSPSQLKGKGKGKSPDTSDLTDDPTTSILQSELVHPYTPPQAMAQPCTTPPPVTTNITTREHSQPITPQTATTPDFPHTAQAPKQTYTCMRSANSCISPPRPVNLFPTNPPPHTTPQQCDPTQVYNIRIPLQGHARLTAIGPISAPPSSTSNSTPTIYYTPTPTNIRPNHPEAGIGPPGPWWDDAGAPP